MPRRRKTRSLSAKEKDSLIRALYKIKSKKRITAAEKRLLKKALSLGYLSKLRGSGLFSSLGSVLSKVIGGLGDTISSVIPI